MRKSGLSIILVSLSLLYCSAGEAADWKFIGKSEDGNVSAFIDKESIRPVSESLVKASVKLDYYKGKRMQTRKTVSHAIGDEEFDCRERRTRTLQFTIHFTDGDTSIGETSYWKFVIPKSILRNIYDFVCTNGKK